MKNNKSKLKGMTRAFKQGAINQLSNSLTYTSAGIVGVLKSNGNVAKGISEAAKALSYMTIIGGSVYVVADLINTDYDEEIVED